MRDLLGSLRRSFRPGAIANLMSNLLPGRVRRKLQRGRVRRQIFAQSTARERFDQIYRLGFWVQRAHSTESRSGNGSSFASTTQFREDLTVFLQREPPGVFLDAPCGDFNFMSHVAFTPRWSYVGGDIAPSLIQDITAKYPDRRFVEFDLVRDPFPACDVWLCRDCLPHLSFAEIRKVFENFARSKARLALITCHQDVGTNCDTITGGFRPLNLTLPPFNLPRPEAFLRDSPIGEAPRIVGIWSCSDIAAALA